MVGARAVLALAAMLPLALSTQVCSVDQFGAVPNEEQPQTGAIQSAIDYCAKQGGGVVLLPSVPSASVGAPRTNWTSGALFLRSNIDFRVAPGAALVGSMRTDNETYPPVYTRVAGTMGFAPASLLNGARCLDLSGYNASGLGDQCKRWDRLTNVRISGAPLGSNLSPQALLRAGAPDEAGTIDGQGVAWYGKACDNYRPTLLGLLWITGLEIQSITLQNSPFWTIHPTFCDGVHVWGVSVKNAANSCNTDGFDPDSTQNALMELSDISCGDDVVAIKSGKDADGIAVGIPARNITVRDCVFGTGHGLSIGSEMSGNVTDVLFSNITMAATERGVRIKSGMGRGGVVENVVYKGIHLLNVGLPLSIDEYYTSPLSPGPAPLFANITVSNLVSINTSGSTAASINCLPQSPCAQGFLVADFNVTGADSWQCLFATVHTQGVIAPPISALC
jgi:polygalacturonase